MSWKSIFGALGIAREFYTNESLSRRDYNYFAKHNNLRFSRSINLISTSYTYRVKNAYSKTWHNRVFDSLFLSQFCTRARKNGAKLCSTIENATAHTTNIIVGERVITNALVKWPERMSE